MDNIPKPQYVVSRTGVLYFTLIYDEFIYISKDGTGEKYTLFVGELLPPQQSGALIQDHIDALESSATIGNPFINALNHELYVIKSVPIEGSAERSRQLYVYDLLSYKYKGSYHWPSSFTHDIHFVNQEVITLDRNVESESHLSVISIGLQR